MPFSELGNILATYHSDDWKFVPSTAPHSDKPYDRHCLYRTSDMALYLIDWHTDGIETSIHGHAEKGCWMKVVTGSLLETRYTPNSELVIGEKLLREGDVGFIHDSEAYHRISPRERSYSLHLYDN